MLKQWFPLKRDSARTPQGEGRAEGSQTEVCPGVSAWLSRTFCPFAFPPSCTFLLVIRLFIKHLLCAGHRARHSACLRLLTPAYFPGTVLTLLGQELGEAGGLGSRLGSGRTGLVASSGTPEPDGPMERSVLPFMHLRSAPFRPPLAGPPPSSPDKLPSGGAPRNCKIAPLLRPLKTHLLPAPQPSFQPLAFLPAPSPSPRP